ncbi:MAG: IS1595 family transposase [Prevotella sp.]|nr:IS1595 family transposase [Prevotella sp.]
MINFSNFKSIVSVINYFHSEDICKKALVDARWGEDVVCPHCGKHHCAKRTDGRFRCNNCKHNFSCLTGTIFENTKLPLQKWFVAMYLISSHKKGVSSCQIMRDCEVMQKTAWFMLQKIRSLYGITDDVALDGEVEMDEMYLGGREANKHQDKHVEGTQGRSTKTKTPIFGMQQRNGNVVAMKVENTQGATLMPIVSQFVEEGSTTYTDEANIYNKLEENGYNHEFVNHSQREYVRANDIHTNGIEGFWAHFKRVIFSTYHMVSKDYLQRYIDEQTYRWNTRKWKSSKRFEDMFLKACKTFDYTDVLSLSSVVSIEHFREYRIMYYNYWKSTHCA